VSGEIDSASDAARTSVSPVVVSLAVDPPSMAAIAETLSAERPRRWLGPAVAVLAIAALIIVVIVDSALAGGLATSGAGTPAPSF